MPPFTFFIHAIAVKLHRWLSRILSAFPRSSDASRRAFSLHRIYSSITKLLAAFNVNRASPLPLVQSQTCYASSLPVSASSFQLNVIPPSNASNDVLSASASASASAHLMDDGQHAGADHLAPLGTQVRPAVRLQFQRTLMCQALRCLRCPPPQDRRPASRSSSRRSHRVLQLVTMPGAPEDIMEETVHTTDYSSTLSKPSTGNPVDSFQCITLLSDIQKRTHLELYPNRRKLKEEHYTELKGILIHASADTLTSHASVAPFDSDELGRMLDLVDRIEGSIGKEDVYAVHVVARLMRLFTSSRFINFFGQPGARLNSDQSVYSKLRGQDVTRSWLIRISDGLLFGGPSAHANELQRVWVDGTVNAPRWKGFISNLSNEWAGFTIYVRGSHDTAFDGPSNVNISFKSTVMLAVDVSFLAIPALATGATSTVEEPGAIITTYVSIIFVVGSLVVSVQLSNRLRGQESLAAKEAATMMFQSTQSMLGTDGFAIMHSLPFALLIWGASPLPVVQSQTCYASSLPASAGPFQLNVASPSDASDAVLLASSSSSAHANDGQRAGADHLAPPGTQVRPAIRLPIPANPHILSASLLKVPVSTGQAPPSRPSSRRSQRPRPALPLVVVPGAPEDIMEGRYKQRIKVERRSIGRVMKPGDMDYAETEIPEWDRCTQPEGSSYFISTTKWITTDNDVSKADLLETINKATCHLLQSARDTLGLRWHENIELVIGLIHNDTEREVCPYYFVDHQQQLLFWLHHYELANIFVNVQGVSTRSHMKSAVEIQYWTHLELYPNKRELKEEHYTELKGILIHASTDTLTSHASVAPFDSDELGRMLDLIDKTEGSIGKEHVYAVYVVARLMRLFTSSRFINFFGQPGARLNSDQSVYSKLRGQEVTRSWLIRISDVLLFGGPSAHANELQRVWVDGTVNAPRWKGFISNLSNEWAGFTIYVRRSLDTAFDGLLNVNNSFKSTVMLAVDVSFLAIPALAAGARAQWKSLVPSSRPILRGQESLAAKEAATMMFQSTQSVLGTDGFAIMHSLPFALLIWGMIFFLLALCFVVFGSGSYITLWTIAPGAIIVGFLTAWSGLGNRGNFVALQKLWMKLNVGEA
ncbi:hypothetical protein BU15DRAFT_81860 [Melanogaster broomeanus]|nr:hypothetical protein BU15DRAFT_81860 [Melanogaster broomeanus]